MCIFNMPYSASNHCLEWFDMVSHGSRQAAMLQQLPLEAKGIATHSLGTTALRCAMGVLVCCQGDA